MQEHQEIPTETSAISKDELARLAKLNEEQLVQEAETIELNQQTMLSNEALADFQVSLTLNREKTLSENVLATIFNSLIKEAEEEKIANAVAQSSKDAKDAAAITAEEERKKKEEEEEEKKRRAEISADASIDLNAVLDFMRDKSPEELSQLINKHISIPSDLIVSGIDKVSMNQLASMAPFVFDFSDITKAIDSMKSRATDNPNNRQTMESLKKLSKDLQSLQSTMEKMSGWNATPNTDDQKLQNYALLMQMKEQLDSIVAPDPTNPEQTSLAKTILDGNQDLKKIHKALSEKIDKELKLDPKIKERYERGERSKGNNKTPEQIAGKIGDLAKQVSFPAGIISVGLRFASMNQLSKAAGFFTRSVSDAINLVDKFSKTCDGNEDTKREFDKLSKSLKETQELFSKLGDENEGWKKNPKGDDVRHNYNLLQQMKKQLEAIENNPLMKDAAALKDVSKVTKALKTKIKKESEKLEKLDPTLKTIPATITPVNTSPPYDSDKGTKYERDQLAAAGFEKEHQELYKETTSNRQTQYFTKDGEPVFSFNKDTREITLHNTDKASIDLAIDFFKNVLKNESLQVSTTPENLSTMQDSFKQAALTSTFKELPKTLAPAIALPTAKEEKKEEIEEKIDRKAESSFKPSMGRA